MGTIGMALTLAACAAPTAGTSTGGESDESSSAETSSAATAGGSSSGATASASTASSVTSASSATGAGGGASTSTAVSSSASGSGDGSYECPGGRYRVVDSGFPGVIRDTQTGLEWQRYARKFDGPAPVGTNAEAVANASAYCQDAGWRLPTLDEALGIAWLSYDSCAWPFGWSTFVSTPTATYGTCPIVASSGQLVELQAGGAQPNPAALCVR